MLPVDKIDFVEAQDDYLSFASGGKRQRKQQTMSDVEAQLDKTRFVRIHRSFLLNVERLARIEPYAKTAGSPCSQTARDSPFRALVIRGSRS